MENSIEKDIKDIKKYISFTSKRENFSHDTDWYWNKELANQIEHILQDYKRVLKEANRYKNMYKAEHEIHLVRNEQLDRKENAVTKCNELIIENAKLKKENEELEEKWNKDTHILQNELDLTNADKINNYIPVQKVKAKIEELDIEISTCEYADDDSEEYKQEVEKDKSELLIARKVLQQLLEESE